MDGEDRVVLIIVVLISVLGSLPLILLLLLELQQLIEPQLKCPTPLLMSASPI